MANFIQIETAQMRMSINLDSVSAVTVNKETKIVSVYMVGVERNPTSIGFNDAKPLLESLGMKTD